MRKPDFFIVSAPRSGTTSLNAYLKQHPDIFLSEMKDILFFGSDLYFPGLPPSGTSVEQYLSCFAAGQDRKRIGDSCIAYLRSKNAAREIKRFNPDADIIIILRNPVELLYSLHSHMIYIGDEDILDFKSALEAAPDRMNGLRPPVGKNAYPWFLDYRGYVNFPEQVARYLDVFGKEKVHIIIFDDFIKKCAEVCRSTLIFLGVNPDFQPKFEALNPHKKARIYWLYKMMLNPPKIFKVFGEKFIKNLMQWNTSVEPRPPMDPVLKKQLQDGFAADVERLGRLIGRDLSHWVAG